METNAFQRAKYAAEPERYMDSEVVLYENVVVLKVLLYPAVIQCDLITILLSLLVHENTDVVTTVVSVLLEWLDPSILLMSNDEDEKEKDTNTNLVMPVVQVAAAVLREGAEYLTAIATRWWWS